MVDLILHIGFEKVVIKKFGEGHRLLKKGYARNVYHGFQFTKVFIYQLNFGKELERRHRL